MAEKANNRADNKAPEKESVSEKASNSTPEKETEKSAEASGRTAKVERKTRETDILVEINLDGKGEAKVDTGIPFFDHMLDAFARHGLFDLTVQAQGDLEVDAHHTVEDTGIVLGQAVFQALGDKRGINRFASESVPMDESLIMAAIDISGRGQLYWRVDVPVDAISTFDTQLAKEFFVAFAANARITLHMEEFDGENAHHIIEASFKALGRSLMQAVAINPRISDKLPSTKGSL